MATNDTSQQTSKPCIADSLQQTDVSKIHMATNDTSQQTSKPCIADSFQQTDVSKVHMATHDTSQQTSKPCIADSLQQTDVSKVHMATNDTSQQTSKPCIADSFQQTDVSKVHMATNDTSQQTSKQRIAATFQQTDVSKVHLTLSDALQQTSKPCIADSFQQTDVSKVHMATNDTSQQTSKQRIAATFQQTDVSKVHLTLSDASQQTSKPCIADSFQQTDVSNLHLTTNDTSQQTSKPFIADSLQQTDVSKVHLTTSDFAQQTQAIQSIECSQQTNPWNDCELEEDPEATFTPDPNIIEYEEYIELQKQAQKQFDEKRGMPGYFKRISDQYGIKGMLQQLQDELLKWKSTKLNIAITGRSGSGKSSLINTIRGMVPDHPLAAMVDVVEATVKPMPYPHPTNKNVILWDLPGVGTPNFLRKYYEEKVHLKDFDFFIIVGCKRFTDDDAWLTEIILKMKKKVYLVRSHIDSDLYNEKIDHPTKYSEKESLDKIRKSTISMLNEISHKLRFYDVPVFLMCTKMAFTKKYDYELFQEKLVYALPELKQKAMVLTLSVLTQTAIEQKVNVLLEQIEMIGSAFGFLGTITGISTFWQWFQKDTIIQEQIHHFRTQLGLDEDTLREKQIDTKCFELTTIPYLNLEKYRRSAAKTARFWTRSSAADILKLVLLDMKKDALKIYGSENTQHK
ncbi:uncharacterized protein LOC128222434 isoform X1 [Mya arenaria]|nr:uncharacterized protein LOC128222434 isoform X1 [Mya arenaria]